MIENVKIICEINRFRRILPSSNVNEICSCFDSIIGEFGNLEIENRYIVRYKVAMVYYKLSEFYAKQSQIDETIKFIKGAIRLGFTDFGKIEKNPSFSLLLKNSNFFKFIASCKLATKYIDILKDHNQYETTVKEDEQDIFFYQKSDSAELVNLKKSMKLETIAGCGSEISKTLNIMIWLHNLIKHDGNSGIDLDLTSLELLELAMKRYVALNCRYISTVFKDCLLSLNIKSRIVICRPKNSLGIDNDCHVINAVYFREMKKWVSIDPTLEAFVFNEKGNMLGLSEIRNKLIKNEPLQINDTANWNQRYFISKSEYLDQYMAKNLYHLASPIKSQYSGEINFETKKSLKYVHLLPLGASLSKNIEGRDYITSCENCFWQTPN